MTEGQKKAVEIGAVVVAAAVVLYFIRHQTSQQVQSTDVAAQPAPVYAGNASTGASAVPTVAPISPTFNISLPAAQPITLPGPAWVPNDDLGSALPFAILAAVHPNNSGSEGCGNCGTSTSQTGQLVSATQNPYGPGSALPLQGAGGVTLPAEMADQPTVYPPIPNPPNMVWDPVGGRYVNPLRFTSSSVRLPGFGDL